MENNYIYHDPKETGGNVPIYSWTNGVPVEYEAMNQLRNVASMPFIHHHVAAMPDVHWGIGATVGSVIPTKGAVIPAAVGVDIGCGMAAVHLVGARASHLPDNLADIRGAIEDVVPVGFGRHEKAPKGFPADELRTMVRFLKERHPEAMKKRKDQPDALILSQYGTLGGGNHFIELCIDERDDLWVMLHSGSRGIGNVIGQHFIELAREDMRKHFINLPDRNLAYFAEGTEHFADYMMAVGWAQHYAAMNRNAMMYHVVEVLRSKLPEPFEVGGGSGEWVVNCHHNYVARENHYGANVWVTRKGAVRAREGDMGIIPGSMGARSYIVRGKGSASSFHSCSHGAGRAMSRGKAKETFTIEDHEEATRGVECRKDAGVLDETPDAYKSIEAVMKAQEDLVEIVHTLKQVVCVKG